MTDDVELLWDSQTLLFRSSSRRIFVESGKGFGLQAYNLIDKPTKELWGEEAATYLRNALLILEKDCRRQAQALPSNWWLIILRSLSPIIYACNSGNYSRYRGFAERVSAWSTRLIQGQIAGPTIGEPQVKRAVRLVVTAAIAEDVHSALMEVNIGAGVSPSVDGPFKINIPDEVAACSKRYNHQLSCNDLNSWATRTGAEFFAEFRGAPALEKVLAAVAMPILPITPESLRENPTEDVVQFAPILFQLTDYVSQLRWTSNYTDVNQAVRALSAVHRVALADMSARTGLWEKLHESGLMVISIDEFDRYVARLCEEANKWGSREFLGSETVVTPEKLIEILTDVEGGRSNRYWGPAVRIGKDVVCVDLLSSVLRLESMLMLGTAGGGTLSGDRAKVWEAAVQAAIDRTSYEPKDSTRALIGKKLKVDGKFLTDIDAVATIGRDLILISCKSWQLSPRRDNGDFNARKNLAKDAIKAAAHWHHVVTTVSKLGEVGGFDFSRYNVRGYLCTSAPLLLLPEERRELITYAPGIDVGTLPELVEEASGTPMREPQPAAWQKSVRISHRHPPSRPTIINKQDFTDLDRAPGVGG